jgi:hypothetical protein
VVSEQNGAKISYSSIFLGKDGWRNVYAGELEVRPPGAAITALPPDKGTSAGKPPT